MIVFKFKFEYLRCLGIVMEILGSVIVFFAALFAVLARDSLPRGMAALSVSYALNVSKEGA